MVPSKLEVAAAIERLIAEEEPWEDFAKTIVLFGNSLDQASSTSFEMSSSTTTEGGSAEGFVEGFGNVSVQKGKEEKHTEKSFGVKKERVGHFKMYRLAPKRRTGTIVFHHFWASDISTASSDDSWPTEYMVEYDVETLEPVSFGRFGKAPIFSFNLGPTYIYLEREIIQIMKGKGAGSIRKSAFVIRTGADLDLD